MVGTVALIGGCGGGSGAGLDANGRPIGEGADPGGPLLPNYASIQSHVFTPICSVCHDGSNPPGGALPGSQNLTAGNSFSSLVNVASLEQPSILRVKPGDPDNSYIIQKLEGTPGISGSRMPFGGPFLDQATINKIRSWIQDGAKNN